MATDKIKLSKKQKEVLKDMQGGRKLRWIDGINPKCFLAGGKNETVSWPTIFALENNRLVERYAGYAHLTELGKSIDL